MATRPRFITKIDWVLLKNQKSSLLETITKAEQVGNKELTDDLEGILHIIDALQDYAVDSMGLSDEEVFSLNNE